MKKSLTAIVFFLLSMLMASNATALTWYLGDDPNKDYIAAYDDVSRIWIPFTLIGTGEEFRGVHALANTFLKDGVQGGSGFDESDWGVDLSMGTYWGFINGEVTIDQGIALTGGVALGNVADGVYTAHVDTCTGLRLGVYSLPNTDGYRTYDWLSPVNNMIITVGDISNTAVPEPTTIMLFGIGLLGVAGISRKKK